MPRIRVVKVGVIDKSGRFPGKWRVEEWHEGDLPERLNSWTAGSRSDLETAILESFEECPNLLYPAKYGGRTMFGATRYVLLKDYEEVNEWGEVAP